MKPGLILQSLALALLLPAGALSFDDKGADANALPKVPAGFEVKVFAKEPLVRQPCSVTFDAKGRLFVGMGPQYRNPKPDTPGDSVVIVEDTRRPVGWLLVWDATFTATEQELVFGDQEEMGFGARVASECTEKNGGALLNSSGAKTAKATWGKPAAWCDYSGTKDGRRVGITLMPGPKNFRESWWHNRDSRKFFVANPFGRAAMGQGPRARSR